jgi:cysteine desulfurase
MTRKTIYLDNQATTACDPGVLDAMWPLLAADYANPHSAHAPGRHAEAAVETARAQIAALLGADPREIVLTSGATEANNLAIKGVARHVRATGDDRRRIVTVATEHPCVTETVRDLAREGFEPVLLSVQPDGRLDPAALDEALQTPTLLVSIMAANNETGVLQDLAALAERVHAAGALLHSDAAQAAGKIPFEPARLGVDLASLSAHKMHGPKGIGALYIRRRPRIRLEPLFSGGGQERGLRSGTLPTPLIVGFGEACRIASAESATEQPRIAALRDRLLALLQAAIPNLAVNGSRTHRLAGNLNLRFPDADALTLLDQTPELAASTGSACGSAAIEPSTVLRAMGLDRAEAASSLRLGLGRFTSPADIERAAALLIAAYGRVRETSPAPRVPIEA